MKSLIFLVFILPMIFDCNAVLSQNDFSGENMPVVLPTSPTASSLGKFGQVPVGLYTGTINLDIPLYTIELDGFQLPIHLNYSSNGIRVAEIPSNVGYGWSLIAGGVVTRQLNDNYDDNDGTREFLPNYPLTSIAMFDYLEDVVNNDNKDIMPDIFSFNFNGYSGKFFLDINNEPQIISASPLSITLLPDFFDQTKTIQRDIEIVTPDGVTYCFGGTNAIEYPVYRSAVNGSFWSDEIKNSWYLTKIILPNGDFINFSYEQDFSTYDLSISQKSEATWNMNHGGTSSLIITKSNAVVKPPVVTQCKTKISRLTTISWRQGSIQLNYSPIYLGIVDQNGLKRVNNLVVTDNSLKPEIIKNWEFDYLETGTDPAFSTNKYSGEIAEVSAVINTKRLFLQKVKEVSNNIENSNPYIFDYYDPSSLPHRIKSFSVDYWGFFNGVKNSDLVSNNLTRYDPVNYEIPELNYTEITDLFSETGANREPNEDFAVKGMLHKVTYPTTGSSSFVYEGHTAVPVETKRSVPKTINLRVQTDDSYSSGWETDEFTTGNIQFNQEYVPINIFLRKNELCSNDNSTKSMELSISENGSNSLPVQIFTFNSQTLQYELWDSDGVATILENADILDGNCFINMNEGMSYTFNIRVNQSCTISILRARYFETNQTIPSDPQKVGGVRIKQIVNNDSDGNETIKNFTYGTKECLSSCSGISRQPLPAIQFNTIENLSQEPVGWKEDINVIITLLSDPINQIYSSQGNHVSYTSVIESLGNNFDNGITVHNYNVQLEELPQIIGDPIPGAKPIIIEGNGEEDKTIYYSNISGELTKIKEIDRTYVSDNRISNSVTGFSSTIRVTRNNLPIIYNISPTKFSAQWRYLSQEKEYDYDENGENPVIKTTDYEYSNTTHRQITKITKTDSEGNSISTNYYYPDSDNVMYYPPSLTAQEVSIIDQMKSPNKHIINNVIYETSYKNDTKILSARRTLYNTYNGTIKKSKIEVYNDDTQMLDEKLVFDLYDIKGNLIQYHRVNDVDNSYIWGYNYSYPIVHLVNTDWSAILSTLNNLNTNYTDIQSMNNTQLNQFFTDLRSQPSMENAQITTFLFDDLKGVVQISDISNKKSFFEYDDFERLKFIKDNDENIVSGIDYNLSPYLTCIPSSIITNAEAKVQSFEIKTNIDNPVYLVSTNNSWVTNINVDVTDANIYNFDISENLTGEKREGKIEVTCGSKTSDISIIQEAYPTLSLPSQNITVERYAGQEPLQITSNTKWNIYCTAPWLTISPRFGEGNKQVIVYYDANNVQELRTTEILISNHDYEMDFPITFNQLPADYINISPTTRVEIPHTGWDTEVYSISSNVDWNVTHQGDFFSYSYTPNPGTGNGSITITGNHQQFTDDQDGWVKLKSTESPNVEVIIEVHQEGTGQ